MPDDHELVALACLSTHLFVDLGACTHISWAREAVTPTERRLLQAPEALPRLLRLLAESRAALKAKEEAAALRGQQLTLLLRAKALASLEAAAAARAATAARLAEVEALAARRSAEAHRKAKAARARHQAAVVELGEVSELENEGVLDRVNACQAALRCARGGEARHRCRGAARQRGQGGTRGERARARGGRSSARDDAARGGVVSERVSEQVHARACSA